MSKFNVPSNEDIGTSSSVRRSRFDIMTPSRREITCAPALPLDCWCFLMGMVVYGFYTAHGDYDRTKELLEKLLPAVIGLLGSAIGFYFGSKNGKP